MSHPTADDHADALAPGTMLGRYEINRLLGRGGMGNVYEAVHCDLKKRVAIKTLLPALAASPEAKQRFLREGQAASRIRHPNVVDITDVVADGPISYLVMEYLEGENLSDFIGRQGPLSPAQTADIMLPVAGAISAAHEQGVIHRDLKPENIFLSTSTYGGTHPKVLDFGISKVLGDRRTMALTATSATFGTTYYLPPEQLRGAREADARSDQYALGTILYECVTARRAFEGDNIYAILRAVAEGDYPPARARRPDLPERMEAIITRAMSVDPTARFESVKQLGSALLEFASAGARALWTPFFSAPSAASQPERAADAGRTMLLPADSAALGAPPSGAATGSGTGRTGRRAPSQPLSASSTTLRDATGEARLTALTARRSKVPLVAAASVVALAAVAFAVARLGGPHGAGDGEPTGSRTSPGPSPRRPATYRIQIATEPGAATLELDGRQVGTGAVDEVLPADGAEHAVIARAPGYKDAIVRFTDAAPPPRRLALVALPPAEPPSNPGARSPSTESTTGGEPSAHAGGVAHPTHHAGKGHHHGEPGVAAPSTEPHEPRSNAPIID
jgi:serine/threonine-protein kinase